MIALIAEYTVRSIALGLLVFLAVKALQVRDPRLERTAWRVVLISALLLPALLKLSSLSPMPTPVVGVTYADLVVLPSRGPAADWSSVLLAVIATISAVLIVRHLFGIARCWAMRQRATRLASETYGALDVRMSSDVTSPATVFSTVLVPQDFQDWTPETQRLAIAHERSHVVGRDFYVQAVAQLYRSLFWFNPFAWWLAGRLALLNEHVSDDAAIGTGESLGRDERAIYARVLLGLAQQSTRNAQLVPMIRTHSLSARVERILGGARAGRANALKALLVAGVLAPVLAAAAMIRSPTSAEIILPRSNPALPLSQPKYPSASRTLGETGTVVLKLHVLEDGSVADATIEESSGHVDLDYSAYYEALRWRLAPGTVDGEPARMWGRFAVTFKLSQE